MENNIQKINTKEQTEKISKHFIKNKHKPAKPHLRFGQTSLTLAAGFLQLIEA